MEIIKLVLSGKYDGAELSPEQVEDVCDWIVDSLFDKAMNDQEFVAGWNRLTKSLDDVVSNFYFTTIYMCCGAFQNSLSRSLDKDILFSCLKLCIALLDFISRHQTYSVHRESVNVWTRKGDALQEMGKYVEAIEIYDAGIRMMGSQLLWEPGMLSPMESMLGVRWGKIEVMLSEKGNCYMKLNDMVNAVRYFNEVLESVKLRGHEDFVNSTFPDGLKAVVRDL